MFDQSAYTVEEGGVVDVVVQLCGSITDDVVVTFTTYDGTAGTAWLFLMITYLYTFHISLDVSFTVDMSIIVDCACNHSS